MATIWKIEIMPKPSAAHAADAIEIVGGEAVRRVTLPQLDLEVYRLHQAYKDKHRREPHGRDLAAQYTGVPAEEIEATLRRLAASGLISLPDNSVLQ